jgi:hypothetical protein
VDDALFTAAKMLLAEFGENLGNGHACRSDDLRVRVDKPQLQFIGDHAADRGFTAAHHSDKDYRPGAEPVSDGLRLTVFTHR